MLGQNGTSVYTPNYTRPALHVTVTPSARPGRANVCLHKAFDVQNLNRVCFRSDQSGNIDADNIPWISDYLQGEIPVDADWGSAQSIHQLHCTRCGSPFLQTAPCRCINLALCHWQNRTHPKKRYPMGRQSRHRLLAPYSRRAMQKSAAVPIVCACVTTVLYGTNSAIQPTSPAYRHELIRGLADRVITATLSIKRLAFFSECAG